MARQRCNCGVLLAVPNGAQTFHCPVCYAIIVCSNNHGYIAPAASNNNGYMVHGASNYNGIPNNYYPNYNRTDYGYNNQQPLWLLPQLLPLSVHGRRRAVLIGICYHGQKKSLKGCINDARSMKNFLVNRLGFPNESVLILTEEENDPYRIPTKRNIRMAMKWLVQGCQSGDSLVFHFSGHASQVPDLGGDEVDGYDEALCPVDYQTEGNILDDEINATIVRPLPHGAKLHAIIDSSFSGTILDRCSSQAGKDIMHGKITVSPLLIKAQVVVQQSVLVLVMMVKTLEILWLVVSLLSLFMLSMYLDFKIRDGFQDA